MVWGRCRLSCWRSMAHTSEAPRRNSLGQPTVTVHQPAIRANPGDVSTRAFPQTIMSDLAAFTSPNEPTDPSRPHVAPFAQSPSMMWSTMRAQN